MRLKTGSCEADKPGQFRKKNMCRTLAEGQW